MESINSDIAGVIAENLSLVDMIACRRVCVRYAEWFRVDRTSIRDRAGTLVYVREHDYEFLTNNYISTGAERLILNGRIGFLRTIASGFNYLLARWINDIGADVWVSRWTPGRFHRRIDYGVTTWVSDTGAIITEHPQNTWVITKSSGELLTLVGSGDLVPGIAYAYIADGSTCFMREDAKKIFTALGNVGGICINYHISDAIRLGIV